MPRPERALGDTGDPLVEFAAGLRKLREKAGSPSYRSLAVLANFSAATLAAAAAGRKLPTLQVTRAYVRACGGDVAEWEGRWRVLAGADRPEPSEPVDGPAERSTHGWAGCSTTPAARAGRSRCPSCGCGRSIGGRRRRPSGPYRQC
ncbi:helix-turn-helix domain-containing protein [Couchioplanes caeruleus]|uniref:helix-turn-helix domain-containing protein n=1 Tax=Couchioplanes caeruleus TaxID=56438 RepID=UPI000A03ACD0|nr:helix-turn-helix domain-containing protein [Couchioplanes caeruleus]